GETFTPFGEEARDLARVNLHVASHEEGDVPGCELQARRGAGVAAVVAAEPHHLDTRIGAIELDENGEGVVGAAVLDEQEFPVERWFCLGYRAERMVPGTDIVAFIVNRNDDGAGKD